MECDQERHVDSDTIPTCQNNQPCEQKLGTRSAPNGRINDRVSEPVALLPPNRRIGSLNVGLLRQTVGEQNVIAHIRVDRPKPGKTSTQQWPSDRRQINRITATAIVIAVRICANDLTGKPSRLSR